MATIEEAMFEYERTEQPLQREMALEARLNYENLMMNALANVDPLVHMNLTIARRTLAHLLTTHDSSAASAIKHLAEQQAEQLGFEVASQLQQFEAQLQMCLLKLLKRYTPHLVDLLQNMGEDFALATALTVGAMEGERGPLSVKNSSPVKSSIKRRSPQILDKPAVMRRPFGYSRFGSVETDDGHSD